MFVYIDFSAVKEHNIKFDIVPSSNPDSQDSVQLQIDFDKKHNDAFNESEAFFVEDLTEFHTSYFNGKAIENIMVMILVLA